MLAFHSKLVSLHFVRWHSHSLSFVCSVCLAKRSFYWHKQHLFICRKMCVCVVGISAPENKQDEPSSKTKWTSEFSCLLHYLCITHTHTYTSTNYNKMNKKKWKKLKNVRKDGKHKKRQKKLHIISYIDKIRF